MGCENPATPWSELERQLSGRPKTPPKPAEQKPAVESSRRGHGDERGPDGGDSPAWSRKRPAYQPPSLPAAHAEPVPYAELHAHSSFSFLDGASDPEQLVEEAVR